MYIHTFYVHHTTKCVLIQFCMYSMLGVITTTCTKQWHAVLVISSADVAYIIISCFKQHPTPPPLISSHLLNSTDLNNYKDPFSPPTPSLPVPSHPPESAQQLVASYEFHPKFNYLSTSTGSAISAGQEVTKLFDEHQQLDEMAKEGLLSSRDRDLVGGIL